MREMATDVHESTTAYFQGGWGNALSVILSVVQTAVMCVPSTVSELPERPFFLFQEEHIKTESFQKPI